jgi:small subunit ribosomal protein S7
MAEVRVKYPVFGKYPVDEVTFKDKGMEQYVVLGTHLVLHTEGRHASKEFGKSKVDMIERLINNLMRKGKFTGKKGKSTKVVMDAFAIIETKTKRNPIQVLVEAIELTAPREEVTRLKYGGISVPKAVDVSPSRRLNIALRNIAMGAMASVFNSKSKKRIEHALADEIIAASKGDPNSYAVAKKEEVERVAASAR